MSVTMQQKVNNKSEADVMETQLCSKSISMCVCVCAPVCMCMRCAHMCKCRCASVCRCTKRPEVDDSCLPQSTSACYCHHHSVCDVCRCTGHSASVGAGRQVGGVSFILPFSREFQALTSGCRVFIASIMPSCSSICLFIEIGSHS